MVENVQRDSSFDNLSMGACGGAVDGRGLPSKHQVQEASELADGGLPLESRFCWSEVADLR